MYDSAPEFYQSILPELQKLLPKGTYETLEKVTKSQIKMEKYWANDFEKLRKECIGEHCFSLFIMLKVISKELIIQTHRK